MSADTDRREESFRAAASAMDFFQVSGTLSEIGRLSVRDLFLGVAVPGLSLVDDAEIRKASRGTGYADYQFKALELLIEGVNEIGRTELMEMVSKGSFTNEEFAARQLGQLIALQAAVKSSTSSFFPANLRDIHNLQLKEVEGVVLGDGLPLYAVPRQSIAEAILAASSRGDRRTLLEIDAESIVADCSDVLNGLNHESVAALASFGRRSAEALDGGHAEASQALSASVFDTLLRERLGRNAMALYVPGQQAPTNAAYRELAVRKFIAFAPIREAYAIFRGNTGEPVPTDFNRHATTHAVSNRQYSRVNAVHGLMLVTSLLCFFNEVSTEG
jgi:hypothetical protein